MLSSLWVLKRDKEGYTAVMTQVACDDLQLVPNGDPRSQLRLGPLRPFTRLVRGFPQPSRFPRRPPQAPKKEAPRTPRIPDLSGFLPRKGRGTAALSRNEF